MLTPYQRKQYSRLGGKGKGRGDYKYQLTCNQCQVELSTTSAGKAQDFIMEHSGHKNFVVDTNVRPNAKVYVRATTLARIENMGHYVKRIHGEDDSVLKALRTTWKAISVEADVEGCLSRFNEILHQHNGYSFCKVWLRAIIRDEEKMIQRVELSASHMADDGEENR